MPIDRPLRLAFTGGFGHHYLARALDDPELNIEALAVAGDGHDDEQTRRRLAHVLERGAAWYDDVQSMAEDFKPDTVSVGTVYAHQWELSLPLLEHGVPVASDKPVAADRAALGKLRDALHRTGGTLITEFDFRSRAAFRAARKAVTEGRIGEVALINAQKSYRFGARPDFYKRREDYGSTLLWIASHAIDAIDFTTGLTFADVFATHANVTRPDYGDMEDHAAALFRMSNRATAVVHADLLRPAAAPTHGDDRLRIVGAHGQVEVRDDRCVLITDDDPPADITDTAPGEPMHRTMLRALLGGETQWLSTAQTLRVAGVLLDARDSADERRRLACGGV